MKTLKQFFATFLTGSGFTLSVAGIITCSMFIPFRSQMHLVLQLVVAAIAFNFSLLLIWTAITTWKEATGLEFEEQVEEARLRMLDLEDKQSEEQGNDLENDHHPMWVG